MLLGQLEQPVAGRPIAVGPQDFAQHSGRREPGQPRQIDGALGVAGPAEHSAFFRLERKQMSGPDEVGRLAGRVDDGLDRQGPLLGGYARAASAVVDRHGKRRAQRGSVRFDHGAEFEPLAHIRQQRHAELAAAVGDHEIHDLGRDFFGGADKIPLVLAIFGVDHNHDFAPGNSLHRGVDRREFTHHGQLQRDSGPRSRRQRPSSPGTIDRGRRAPDHLVL